MSVRELLVMVGCVLMPLSLAWPAAADTTVNADLVEQNNSGTRGTVRLTATDAGALRVLIRAEGLMPGPHAQHIHGAVGAGHFHCSSLRDDTDGDGWLTNEEASGEYGNVFLALTTRGDVSAESGLDLERMPVAGRKGRLHYERTIPAAQVPRGLLRELANVHVVQHGIDANGNGEYDLEALGESTFAAGLGLDGVPEEATNPTSCGVLVGAASGQRPRGGVETEGPPPGRDAVTALTATGLLLLLLALSADVWRRRTVTRDR
jgi:hypothetical protein